MDKEKKREESDVAGKRPDIGIKTLQGMDNEGHLKGSNQSAFNECSAQEHQRSDHNELNQTDNRETVSGTESV